MRNFNGREFWDKIISLTNKPLFERWKYINGQLFCMLYNLNERDGLIGPGEKKNPKDLLKMYKDRHGAEMGTGMIGQLYALQTSSYRFFREIMEPEISNEAQIIEKGFTEQKYLECLKSFSNFIVFAYPYQCPNIPPEVENLYIGLEFTTPDLTEISVADLANNPRDRIPVIFIIDDALYMGNESLKALKALKDSFDQLIDQIIKSPQLSESVELYVATCGGGFNQIVDFATINRQDIVLSTMTLKPKGRCLMGQALNGALDRLQERIKQYGNENIRCFCPWLIVLSNGSFHDMETNQAAYDRVHEMRRNNELKVYPVGVTNGVKMDNMILLNKKEAGIPSTFEGFFKDVFTSLKASQDSQPADDKVGLVHTNGWTKGFDE